MTRMKYTETILIIKMKGPILGRLCGYSVTTTITVVYISFRLYCLNLGDNPVQLLRWVILREITIIP